jgi:hypothetical protein
MEVSPPKSSSQEEPGEEESDQRFPIASKALGPLKQDKYDS